MVMRRPFATALAALLLAGAGCVAQREPAGVNAPASAGPPLSPVLSDERACTEQQLSTTIGELIPPVTARYAHLRQIGPLFTAADCGPARLSDLYGGGEAMFIAFSNVTLAADATDDVRAALGMLGYACADPAAAPCRVYQVRGTIQVNDLVKLRQYAPQIERETCIDCE